MQLDRLFDRFGLLLVLEFSRHIDFVQITGIPHLAGRQHVEDGGEDHPGDSDDSPFLSAAFHDAFILAFVVRRHIGFHHTAPMQV